MFNVLGGALMLPLVYLGVYNHLVELISPVALRAETIGVHIAIAHSAFNVVAAFMVLPFVGLLERLVLKILPTRRGQIEQAPATGDSAPREDPPDESSPPPSES